MKNMSQLLGQIFLNCILLLQSFQMVYRSQRPIITFLHKVIMNYIVYSEHIQIYEIGLILLCQLQKALYELKQSF